MKTFSKRNALLGLTHFSSKKFIQKIGLPLFFLLFSLSTFANDNEIYIVDAPTAKLESLKQWAKMNGATETFVGLADMYWTKSIEIGINPVIAYCQAAKETGFGGYRGIITETSYNPCGLKQDGKNGNTVEDYMHFESWEDGVDAHLDHLALYAGMAGYPKEKEQTKDPRHYKYLFGIGATITKLSLMWPVSRTYAEELTKLVQAVESL